MSPLLLMALALVLPNPAVTPGAVRPLTLSQVCATQWGLDRRHVTATMKRQVAANYHLKRSQWSQYEFDHLIPRELAGADEVANLWPQTWTSARKKDRLENRLHALVCKGQLALDTAQQAIAWDWTAAYRTYIGAAQR